MENCKIAIIYGDMDEERNDKKGEVEKIGNINDSYYHIICLLNLAKDKFSDVKEFNMLNIHHTPEIASYFFTKLGHIIFLNTSNKKSKMGFLFLPNNISDVLKEALYNFVNEISDYQLYVFYNLEIIDGVLEGEQLQLSSVENVNAIDLLNLYFSKKNGKIR